MVGQSAVQSEEIQKSPLESLCAALVQAAPPSSDRVGTHHNLSFETNRDSLLARLQRPPCAGPARRAGLGGEGEGPSAADRQASHGAQVTQEPADPLLELRQAGQRVGRLQLARVVQPGLQDWGEGEIRFVRLCLKS